MSRIHLSAVCARSMLLGACSHYDAKKEEARELEACKQMVLGGLLKIPETRDLRFLGKVQEATAICRGGERALQFRMTPWVDWSQYWGTGDMESLPKNFVSAKGPSFRGV